MADIDDIEHVIVVMLENRSFDQIFGFMQYENGAVVFDGLNGDETNPEDPSMGATLHQVKPDAVPNINPDPGHSHVNVMRQIFFRDPPFYPLPAGSNQGFVYDFKQRIANVNTPPAGLLRKIWWYIQKIWAFIKCLLFGQCPPPLNDPADIMNCFGHQVNGAAYQLRVLDKLAKGFALCDAWFCSVPGETWPNRNFAHAGTSDGTVDIEVRFYSDTTIFEKLADNGHSWRIYYDSLAQALCFPALWFGSPGGSGFRNFNHFATDVANDNLPSYTFIEPRHFKFMGNESNSQHPGNNPGDDADFVNGEDLVAEVYNRVTANQAVWKKTMIIVTYDEHGGCYDHRPPPTPDEPRYGDGNQNGDFRFDFPGPRVPAIIISPYTQANTIDSTVYDHASIIKSLHTIFELPGELTNRDQNANPFDFATLLSRPNTNPRLNPGAGPDEIPIVP